MLIRPIETEYNGYRFRSRLEARWAVFMDALSIPYVYEPEGFEMEGMRYLPDFWLPGLNYWVEVKPTSPNAEEREKAERLAAGTNFPVLFLIDVPAVFTYKRLPDGDGAWTGKLMMAKPGERTDGRIGWAECKCCSPGRVDVALDGEACFESEVLLGSADRCTGLRPDTHRIRRAVEVARSTRFERLPKNMRNVLGSKGWAV